MRRPRVPKPSERDWRVLDRVFAGLMLAAAVLDVTLTSARVGPLALNILVYSVAALSFLLRRTHPLATTAIVFGALAVAIAWLTGPEVLMIVAAMSLAASYSVGAHAERRPALVGLAIGVVAVTVSSAIENPDDIVWPVTFFVFVPWLVGRILRNQAQLARELAVQADLAELARDDEERRAIAAERSAIARELHDVLAHNLSVMVVQAGAGARIVERDPDTAAEAAELIAATGREALGELRALLGPVHREDSEPLDGVPSLRSVDRLVRRAREAGLTVRLRVEGEAADLPAGVDLTAYRVVQEALTNTLKHAGDARAEVTVRYEPWEVVVEVEDDGAGLSDEGKLSDVGGGHGLVGMRERVSVYGGLLQAGRRRGGGFAVRARLPRMSALSREPVA